MYSTKTQQIHKEFRNSLNLSTVKAISIPEIDESISKVLSSLGLTSSKNYEALAVVREKSSKIKEINSVVKQLQEIESKYPSYRIISLSRVMELCKKYNLAVGTIEDYTEMIPEENIKHLQLYTNDVSKEVKVRINTVENLVENHIWSRNCQRFFIAAPPAFFKKNLTNVSGFMIRLPKIKASFQDFSKAFANPFALKDPIVLQPLDVFSREVYMHIPTAWEVEAFDPYITTQIVEGIDLQ